VASSLSSQARLAKLGKQVFKDNICLLPLMISVISHLNRLPYNPKHGMQGDELRKSFPEGTLELIVENEACLCAGFSGSCFIGWRSNWGEHSLGIYKRHLPGNMFFLLLLFF
jgi:hypothetical protein